MLKDKDCRKQGRKSGPSVKIPQAITVKKLAFHPPI